MADKDVIKIGVGTYTDEKSIVDTARDIKNGVLKQFKDGHIELPVALTEKFDEKKVSKKLLNAQADFIKEYNDLSAKGFSASDAQLKSFIKTYDEFKRQISSNKQNSSKQNRALKETGISEIAQSYHNQMDKLANDVAKLVAEGKLEISKATKKLIKMPKMSRAKSQREYDKQLEKEFDDYVEQLKQKQQDKTFITNLKKGAGRGKASAPGASVNLGTRTSNMDDTYLSEKGLQENDRRGTYYGRNSLMKQAAETEKLNRKQPVTVRNDKKKAREVESKMNLNNAEINTEKAVISAKEGAREFGGIENGRKDASPERYKMFTKGVADYINKAGKSDWDSMSLLTNMTFNRHSSKGAIGVGDGTPTGEGKNHQEAIEVSKDMLDTFTDIMSDGDRSLKAYQSQQRRILATLKDWKGLEKLDREMSSSKTSSKKTADRDNSILVKELKNNQRIATETNNAIETQTTYDKLDNVKKNTDTAKGLKVNTENKDINKENKNTGMDTDENTRILLGELKNIKDILSSVLPSKNNTVKKENIETSSEPTTESSGDFSRSEISTSLKDPAKWYIKLTDVFADLFGVTANYKKVLAATSKEQDQLAAEQIKKYGISRGNDYVGDKAQFARRISLWRGDSDKFNEFFKNLKLTKGIKIDTTEVTSKLASVLSGKQMRNAQMGGSPLRNLFGYRYCVFRYAFT